MPYGIRNKGINSIISDAKLRDFFYECDILGFYKFDTANDYGTADKRLAQLSK